MKLVPLSKCSPRLQGKGSSQAVRAEAPENQNLISDWIQDIGAVSNVDCRKAIGKKQNARELGRRQLYVRLHVRMFT